jgi:hypothetical protein
MNARTRSSYVLPIEMKRMLLVAFLISMITAGVAQQNSSCPPTRVEYKKYVVDASKVKVDTHPKGTLTVAEDQKQMSPQGTRWLAQSIAKTATVTIGDGQKALVRVTLPNDGGNGITSRWMNEKLVFLE